MASYLSNDDLSSLAVCSGLVVLTYCTLGQTVGALNTALGFLNCVDPSALNFYLGGSGGMLLLKIF